MVRKGLSKKRRFDVFKRDGFTCQYCGATPPAVVLHVDHMIAVAAGGSNDEENLVTACDACNLGKGARDLAVAPQSLADRAAQVAEREEQLAGYQAVFEARRQRIEDELWRVAELLVPSSPERGMSRDWTRSIRRFNERLGVHRVLEAAEIARTNARYGDRKTFLYFCSVCWNWIRDEEGK